MPGPLQGIRVLDTSEGAQGPWAGALLGDLGANVIKLERPEGEMQRYYGPYKKGVALPLVGLNRNKKGLILDLKSDEDREKAYELVKRSDVVIENFRPGVVARLRFDYETLCKINPRIIYCSASGFGQVGPYRHKPCIDPIAQAIGGLASVTGPPGGPGERARFVAADMTSPLILCEAIVVALFVREVTGEGQYIETCQLDSTIALQAGKIAEFFASGMSPIPMGSATSNVVPSQSFRTRDGKYINVSAPTEKFWRNLCHALSREDLITDPRYSSNTARVKNQVHLVALLADTFQQRDVEIWLQMLEAADVPCGKVVWDISELYDDPQILAQRRITTVEHPVAGKLRVPAPVWDFTRTPAAITKPGPIHGEYTYDEVLAELNEAKS